MKTAKSALVPFYEGACVFHCAKITAIEQLNVPGLPGCQRLVFGDLDAEANVLAWWAQQNEPRVGGWFVVPETGGAGFMRDDDFRQRFIK